MAWTTEPVSGPCWVLIRDWMGWTLARQNAQGAIGARRIPLASDARTARKEAHGILSRRAERENVLARLEAPR